MDGDICQHLNHTLKLVHSIIYKVDFFRGSSVQQMFIYKNTLYLLVSVGAIKDPMVNKIDIVFISHRMHILMRNELFS